MRPALLAIVLALGVGASLHAQVPLRWAVARRPTPVLNTPDIRSVYGGPAGRSLHRDRVGLVRELETVVMPGTVLAVHEELTAPGGLRVLRVTTDEYPFPTRKGYFVDARFVTFSDTRPPDRVRRLPSSGWLRFRLLSAVGSLYVWGGNVRQGLPEMLEYYPPSVRLDRTARRMWMLRGVDCSGLLYEATDGYTPRNASALVRFGRPVTVAGLTAAAIAARVAPFDLIVWRTHVVLVLDRSHVIQSKTDDLEPGAPGGVRVEPIVPYLERLLKERTPVDDFDRAGGVRSPFVVRRWYPDRSHP